MKELYPQRRDYLDVYDHYGLIGRRAVLAHGVHLDESEFERCHASGTALAHCPTSNLFLGSGLFRLRDARDPRRPVHVGLGTDIGAGTSFSLLATMGEAYKVAQLQSRPIDAIEAFYLATLGGARALALDDRIGTLGARPRGRPGGARPERDAAAGFPQPAARDRSPRLWRCWRRSATIAPCARPMWRESSPMRAPRLTLESCRRMVAPS